MTYFKRFWFDTALSGHPVPLTGLTEIADKSRILFGTDYPYISTDKVTAESDGFDSWDGLIDAEGAAVGGVAGATVGDAKGAAVGGVVGAAEGAAVGVVVGGGMPHVTVRLYVPTAPSKPVTCTAYNKDSSRLKEKDV